MGVGRAGEPTLQRGREADDAFVLMMRGCKKLVSGHIALGTAELVGL